MAETGRSTALAVAMPLVVAGNWTFQGLLALDSGGEVSGKAVLVWLSFVAAGIGLGTALAILGLRRAARLGRTPGIFGSGNPRPTDFLMFGLFQVSMGVGPVYETASSAGDWAFLVFTSVGGGALIGAAHGMQQALMDRASTRQETAATGS